MTFLILGATLLNIYAVILILARALVYRVRLYRPMLWNVVLSLAPVLLVGLAVACWLALGVELNILRIIVLAILGVVWLLMLPNASYLITELNFSHRDDEDPVPLWYDIILVITLAMSGVVNTIVNVFLVHALLAYVYLIGDDEGVVPTFHPLMLLAVVGVMLLLGLGMYLGRYLRLNSWDIRHPASFLRKVRVHFRAPGNIAACVGFSVTYALFLAILYVIIALPIFDETPLPIG